MRASEHPDRKPNDGMLRRAFDILPIDPAKSLIVGDREVDVQAGKSAGLAGAVHLRSHHKDFDSAREQALALEEPGFPVLMCDDADDLTGLLAPLWDQ